MGVGPGILPLSSKGGGVQVPRILCERSNRQGPEFYFFAIGESAPEEQSAWASSEPYAIITALLNHALPSFLLPPEHVPPVPPKVQAPLRGRPGTGVQEGSALPDDGGACAWGAS